MLAGWSGATQHKKGGPAVESSLNAMAAPNKKGAEIAGAMEPGAMA
jgi:hypothetical protein